MPQDDRIVRAIQARVLHENKSREDLLREMSGAVVGGVPVSWNNHDGRRHGGGMARVVDDDGNVMQYAVPPKHVCGQCKNFNITTGRKKMINERFAERLVRDDRWKLHHLGVPLDHVGLCDESQGRMATTTVSPAIDKAGNLCPGFRPK